MNIKLFPILAFSFTDEELKGTYYNGTAFLMGNTGHFYTAGHNFYKKERGRAPEKLKCFALINGELFNIQEIHLEYDSDSGGFKKDFAFGQIANFKNIPDSKNIACDTPIALGYSSRELDFEKIETVNWNEIEFKLYKVPISIGTNSMAINTNFIESFENILFYTMQSSISLEGLSGGPILYADEILGVLVSKYFITKEYIDKIVKR